MQLLQINVNAVPGQHQFLVVSELPVYCGCIIYMYMTNTFIGHKDRVIALTRPTLENPTDLTTFFSKLEGKNIIPPTDPWFGS